MVLCIQGTPPSVPLCGEYCAGSISAAGRGSHAGRLEVGEGQTVVWLTHRHLKL